MSKVNVIDKESGDDINIGTFFTGTVGTGSYSGLFVKSYDGIVSLNNALNTWGLGCDVKDFCEVDVDIIIKKRDSL